MYPGISSSPGLILKGLVLGFSIAAPVGPIGVLCIRRTLANGFRSGLVCGLGAATADAIFGGMSVQTDAIYRFNTFLLVLGVFSGSAL